jgi:hypothetical protein
VGGGPRPRASRFHFSTNGAGEKGEYLGPAAGQKGAGPYVRKLALQLSALGPFAKSWIYRFKLLGRTRSEQTKLSSRRLEIALAFAVKP